MAPNTPLPATPGTKILSEEIAPQGRTPAIIRCQMAFNAAVVLTVHKTKSDGTEVTYEFRDGDPIQEVWIGDVIVLEGESVNFSADVSGTVKEWIITEHQLGV